MMQFDTGIYDFTSPQFETAEDELQVTDASVYLSTELKEDDIRSLEQAIIDEEIPLEAAPEVEEGNLEALAMEARTTPDTGAPIFILIILALLSNLFFFTARLRK
jgi:hypothetical protein